MLTFFRHIRKSLLGSGQVRKYLVYAIGEIALVVIGILIALQINNWNQQRIDSSKRQDYIKLLLRDLSKDTMMLNSGIMEMTSIINQQDELRKRMSSELATSDTLLKIAKYEINPMLEIQDAYSFNTNTITSLLATGQLELFDQEIADELLSLNTMQQEAIQEFNDNWTVFSLLIAEYARDFRFNTRLNLIQGGPLLELAWEDPNMTGLANTVASIGGSKSFITEWGIDNLRTIKKQTLRTIELLYSYE